jgi:hypothetical protein
MRIANHRTEQDPEVDTDPNPMLATLAQAARGALVDLGNATLTYQALARALGLRPPHTIHRVIQALELTMREDAADGRPFIAARVVSRTRGGLPAPGFFDLATRLGYHDGSESGAAARAFHEVQLRALSASASMNAKASGQGPDPRDRG